MCNTRFNGIEKLISGSMDMPGFFRARSRALTLVFLVTLAMSAVTAVAGDEGPGPMFNYRFELAERGYGDVVSLVTGEKISGKVLEWADEILVFDANAGVRQCALNTVESFDLRRNERHNAVFAKPDLTIAFIERLPRDASWHGHVKLENGLPKLVDFAEEDSSHPKADDAVTFRVHILNAGAADSAAVPCRVSMDGAPIGESVSIAAIKPGDETVFDVKWAWQEGQHELKIELDPEAKAPDALRWNNTFTQFTRGLAVTFAVARDRYEAFKSTPNMVDSYCFEDFAQYHIRTLNALFAASVYPSAPHGAEERLYCDRIVVVEDPLDANSEDGWIASLHRDGKADAPVEYAALARFGRWPSNASGIRETAMVNWATLQDIGRQIGLADLKRVETTIEQCYVYDITERYAMVQYLRPGASLMHTPGGFHLTEEQVGYLNHTIGRAAWIQRRLLLSASSKNLIESDSQ
ncbi:MAG: hypothetical protein IPK83_09070 [Planctomycetes bacterium]|nr:hypothetical protein [Planctomycetota bacterium]